MSRIAMNPFYVIQKNPRALSGPRGKHVLINRFLPIPGAVNRFRLSV